MTRLDKEKLIQEMEQEADMSRIRAEWTQEAMKDLERLRQEVRRYEALRDAMELI